MNSDDRAKGTSDDRGRSGGASGGRSGDGSSSQRGSGGSQGRGGASGGDRGRSGGAPVRRFPRRRLARRQLGRASAGGSRRPWRPAGLGSWRPARPTVPAAVSGRPVAAPTGARAVAPSGGGRPSYGDRSGSSGPVELRWPAGVRQPARPPVVGPSLVRRAARRRPIGSSGVRWSRRASALRRSRRAATVPRYSGSHRSTAVRRPVPRRATGSGDRPTVTGPRHGAPSSGDRSSGPASVVRRPRP